MKTEGAGRYLAHESCHSITEKTHHGCFKSNRPPKPAHVGRPGPEPGASLFVWLVWGVLLVVALIYVARFGPDVPLWDDYAVIPQLAGVQPVTPQWLWSQHSEHRIPLARLILLGTFHLTGRRPAGVMFLIVGLLAAVAGLLIVAARKASGAPGMRTPSCRSCF